MRTDHLGGTLADRLRSGPLDRAELDQLARDLLGMLASLHADGTLHTDLNPESVRLDSAGRLHSSKIGAQRSPAAPQGPTGRNYLAPEVLAGGAADVGADLFACGVLLGDAAGPDASAPVLVLIGMLTASEPDMRPASATEALALLGAAAAPPAPRAPLPAPVVGYRQSFDKPPAPAPVPGPTQALEFPPAVDFPPVEAPAPLPPAYPPAMYSPAPYPPAPALPRLRRRPGRLVLATAGAVAAVAIVLTGAAILAGGDAAEPTAPAPASEAPLQQQLDGLDSAIEGVTR